uniref:ATPase/GTPase, AAA15 family n=1 Tax=Candidatus Kentrum sp. MB TaxID=2138164 RepID=A0A451BFS2_9GAMM|nr:MAG: ATPase/GTPase, AAA15 family [Candidatus Kentron sp. MB]VFK77145.1 MAG: ATPase/GTPase, AAA15 family [Candidatus Kentron sp. MB]
MKARPCPYKAKAQEVFTVSFQQISIRNFRAIASLDIDNIKQVNLLTGENNCGKSSVLEAIFLLVGMSNPQLAVTVHNLRGLTLNDDKDFSYLFHGFDFSKNLSINGILKSQRRTLSINPIYPTFSGILEQLPGGHEPAKNKSIPITIGTGNAPNGLAFDFSLDERSFHAEVKIARNSINSPGINTGGQINIQPAPDYRESFQCHFINPATIMNGLYQGLEAILVRKESDGIIEALREIEPKLRDLRLGTGEKIYADISDIGKLVPINIMGDGVIKILAILTTILETRDGILLIDEIENGLHYSALAPLWKAVFKMARERNVQLFIATHSYECIEAMTEVYQGSELEKEFISSFRIDRDEEGQHLALQYETDTLLFAMKKNFEVR